MPAEDNETNRSIITDYLIIKRKSALLNFRTPMPRAIHTVLSKIVLYSDNLLIFRRGVQTSVCTPELGLAVKEELKK